MLPPLPSCPKPEPPRVQFTPYEYAINIGKISGFRVMMARFPGNNQEHPDSSGYYLKILPQLLRDDRIAQVIPFRKSSTPIPAVRNNCVQTAIREDCDYILMIDNDISPDCEEGGAPFWETAWRFMMARRARESREMEGDGKEVENSTLSAYDYWWHHFAPCAVASPYCGEPPEEQCYAMRLVEFNGAASPDGLVRMTNVDRYDAARRTGMENAPAAATGLILYDTRMFYYLPPPWFDYEYEDAYHARVVTTEDIYQTRAAAFLGMPIYVAWDCWAGHMKLKKVKKPFPVPMEMLRGSLREAFEKQVTVTQKLHFRHPDAT